MFDEEVKTESAVELEITAVNRAAGPVQKISEDDLARIKTALYSVSCSSQTAITWAYMRLKDFFRSDEDEAGFKLLSDWVRDAPYIDEENAKEREHILAKKLAGWWSEEAISHLPISIERLLSQFAVDRRNGMFNDAVPWTVDKEPNKRSHLDVAIALKHLGVRLYKNSFDRRCYIEGFGQFSELDDDSVRALWMRVQEIGLKPSKEFFWDCVLEIAERDRRHPILDQFDKLPPWDGTFRIGDLFIKYAGARNTPLNRWIGEAIMIAHVRRLKKPGTKFDVMPVLEGPQGVGKSSFIKVIGGDYFEDGLQLGADPKIVMEQAAGKSVIEISELAGMSNREIENVKAMITRTHDTARPAYGKTSVTVPRPFTLWGTTNSREYLRDSTGNRRFLPIEVGVTSPIDLAKLKNDLPQLLAEAIFFEAKGKSIQMDPALYDKAAELQESRTVTSTTLDKLAEFIDEDKYGEIDIPTIRRMLGEFSGESDVLAPWDNRLANEVFKAMTKLGFEKKKVRSGGGREIFYRKPGPNGECPELEFNRPFLRPRGELLQPSRRSPEEKIVKLTSVRRKPADTGPS